MSRMKELIKKLCPNGVEYKKIGDIANYRRGSFPQPYTNDECITAYTKTAPFSTSELKKMDYLQKIQTLEILNNIKIPLPFDAEVETEFYRALCDSYSSRYQLYNNTDITPVIDSLKNIDQCYDKASLALLNDQIYANANRILENIGTILNNN